MGVSCMGSCCDTVSLKNPNPRRFKLINSQCFEVGVFVIVTVKYVGCTNFEGRKIIVFENIDLNGVKSLCEIDPHFTESSAIVARFVPTAHGMWLAKKLCESLD